MSTHDHLQRIPVPAIEELGWSKVVEVTDVARSEGGQSDRPTWLHTGAKSWIKTRVYACAGQFSLISLGSENPGQVNVLGQAISGRS
jgi:hypothetical protein